MRGRIKWYSNSRGFGFITPDEDDEEEVFFHISDVVNYERYEDRLQEGDRVKYKLERNEKGLIAKCIALETEE